MKRYILNTQSLMGVDEHPEGYFVSSTDYDAAQARIAALEAALREITEARQSELAYVQRTLKAARRDRTNAALELDDLLAWAANRSTQFPLAAPTLETTCVHEWQNIGPGGFEMPVIVCLKCGRSQSKTDCQHEWSDQAICKKCGAVDPHPN